MWESYAFGPLAPLAPGSTKSLGVLPAGTALRFALTADGANGGEQVIYQDSHRNPKGRELFASNLPLPEDADYLVVAFEDNPGGGDGDFNDVVLKVKIIPNQVVGAGVGTTQFDDVIPGKAGINSSRGRRGVKAQLENLELKSASKELTSELFELPTTGSLTFSFLDDRSPMKLSLIHI